MMILNDFWRTGGKISSEKLPVWLQKTPKDRENRLDGLFSRGENPSYVEISLLNLRGVYLIPKCANLACKSSKRAQKLISSPTNFDGGQFQSKNFCFE